jgi:hypothetical protein
MARGVHQAHKEGRNRRDRPITIGGPRGA